MRPGTFIRLTFGLSGLVSLASVTSADGQGDQLTGVAGLESPRFETRREAEKALFLEGMSILSALEARDADVDARIAAFDKLLSTCEREDTPAAARAAARVATRIETSATDDQVRHIPRLLRVRLDRVLPLVVIDRSVPSDRAENARIDGRAVRGLLPEARPILLDRLQSTDDPRALAGALASL